MKLLGGRIKYYRRNLGLSQKELADGICTQATISLIEKKNKVPSIHILLSVCERLNVDVNDIVMTSRQNEIKRLLINVRQEIVKGDFLQADKLLMTLKQNKLSDNMLLKQFFVYSGLLDLMHRCDSDKAIFNFNQALNQHLLEHTPQDVVAMAGLALAYVQKDDLEYALTYVQSLQSLLSKSQIKTHLDKETALFVNYALGVALFKVGQSANSKVYVDQGLEIAKSKQTLLFLAIFYGLHAIFETDETEKDDKMIAKSMAEVVHVNLPRLLFEDKMISEPQ
ncbi:helix-turn-helix domain-containing protein [Agrilactobacillus yilanensis]|uniref:Helix-turn-helix domain-containing protein n=1 Tax=Agrilactobacillus yilanensis TaxID=2485997 RepID=A0ABW4J3Y5_9LACO|nr:helix-turn-helix transcriptional regulator [Agrilactobacillus yilanensis]